jgi:hypothetical protein
MLLLLFTNKIIRITKLPISIGVVAYYYDNPTSHVLSAGAVLLICHRMTECLPGLSMTVFPVMYQFLTINIT